MHPDATGTADKIPVGSPRHCSLPGSWRTIIGRLDEKKIPPPSQKLETRGGPGQARSCPLASKFSRSAPRPAGHHQLFFEYLLHQAVVLIRGHSSEQGSMGVGCVPPTAAEPPSAFCTLNGMHSVHRLQFSLGGPGAQQEMGGREEGRACAPQPFSAGLVLGDTSSSGWGHSCTGRCLGVSTPPHPHAQRHARPGEGCPCGPATAPTLRTAALPSRGISLIRVTSLSCWAPD